MFEQSWNPVASGDDLLEVFLDEIGFFLDNGIAIDWFDNDEVVIPDESKAPIVSKDSW